MNGHGRLPRPVSPALSHAGSGFQPPDPPFSGSGVLPVAGSGPNAPLLVCIGSVTLPRLDLVPLHRRLPPPPPVLRLRAGYGDAQDRWFPLHIRASALLPRRLSSHGGWLGLVRHPLGYGRAGSCRWWFVPPRLTSSMSDLPWAVPDLAVFDPSPHPVLPHTPPLAPRLSIAPRRRSFDPYGWWPVGRRFAIASAARAATDAVGLDLVLASGEILADPCVS